MTNFKKSVFKLSRTNSARPEYSLKRQIFTLIILLFFAPFNGLAASHENGFPAWRDKLRAEVVSDGISAETFDITFADIVSPNPKVISLDRNQPEMTQTFDTYLSAQINDRRVRIGQRMMQKYPTWLERIEDKYSVQKRFLLALWGIESGYGENQGSFSVIHSLATLAYDGRRSNYFRKELIEALRLIDDGTIPHHRMRGSWAGAMGYFQFMPSSFRQFAIDEDRSGSINIWHSVPDALGSAANYLAGKNWQYDQTWGREVKLPVGFDVSIAGLETRFSLAHWQNLGVRRINGRSLPTPDMAASLVIPDGPQGRAYLVYDNFRVLMSWNRSVLFSLAVGILSDNFK